MSFDPRKAMKDQHEAARSQNWFMTKIHEFNAAHNRLKHHIHTAYRYPLPPWGRTIMGFVYFSIPVIGGYAISTWVVSKSESTVDERFTMEDKDSVQGLGDKVIVKDESGERREVVGAGGWGGGVRLATSDQETQIRNKINLERFFRKQRRLKEKREQEAMREEGQDQ